ncbi:hypothetical protein LINPERPRIM_LOCUS5054, partial [Linum perenne]
SIHLPLPSNPESAIHNRAQRCLSISYVEERDGEGVGSIFGFHLRSPDPSRGRGIDDLGLEREHRCLRRRRVPDATDPPLWPSFGSENPPNHRQLHTYALVWKLLNQALIPDSVASSSRSPPPSSPTIPLVSP